MNNVKTTFFITKDEAKELHEYIDYTMPQYELDNGSKLYAHIVGADIMTYHAYDTLEAIIAYREMIDRNWKNR